MTILNMRKEVADLYPNTSWRKRVSQMQDKQVMAIYFKTLDKEKEKERNKNNERKDYDRHQGSRS